MAPYAPGIDKDGYWGEPTSTIDWCEENYADTYFIAEFWNTITNLALIVPPVIAIVYYWRLGVEFRYLAQLIALATVGIGSWLFHMTLKYEMQLMDELPMILGTSLLTYVMHWTCNGCGKDRVRDVAIAVSYSVIVSAVYIAVRDPVFHQTAYACLVFFFMYKTWEACKKFPEITRMVLASFLLFTVAFTLWNIDNIFCVNIRKARHGMPSYMTPLTQLHGWWHIFVGASSWMHALITLHARCLSAGKTCTIKMFCYVYPYLEIHEKWM